MEEDLDIIILNFHCLRKKCEEGTLSKNDLTIILYDITRVYFYHNERITAFLNQNGLDSISSIEVVNGINVDFEQKKLQAIKYQLAVKNLHKFHLPAIEKVQNIFDLEYQHALMQSMDIIIELNKLLADIKKYHESLVKLQEHKLTVSLGNNWDSFFDSANNPQIFNLSPSQISSASSFSEIVWPLDDEEDSNKLKLTSSR